MYSKFMASQLGYCSSFFHQPKTLIFRFIATHQKEIRADTYKGLVDALESGKKAKQIGKKTILPSTMIGSSRWYQARFQDAMAIVSLTGKPSLFITMYHPN